MQSEESEFICDYEKGAEPVDDATKAAIEEAQASVRRGEAITLEQSDINLRKRLEAWRESRKENLAA